MITLPTLAQIKAKALAALEANALQAQQPGFSPDTDGCRYSGPCAIGAALHPNQIRALTKKGRDTHAISELIDTEEVRVNPADDPYDTARTLERIQHAHDQSDLTKLRELLTS